jgi:hypothetical protein
MLLLLHPPVSLQEYAASTSRLSLPYFNTDSEMGGGDSVPSNYSAVFGRMVDALQQSPSSLRLGMVVTGVTLLRATPRGAVAGVQVRLCKRSSSILT